MATFDKHVHIAGAVRAELVLDIATRYRDGASLRTLADRYGRSYGFIQHIVTESETPMRTRGGPRPGPRPERKRQPARSDVVGAQRAALARDVTARYIAGASIRSLAARYEMSYGFVHNIVSESGVPFRPRGGSHTTG